MRQILSSKLILGMEKTVVTMVISELKFHSRLLTFLETGSRSVTETRCRCRFNGDYVNRTIKLLLK